jgi:hypothetical protein
MPSDMLARWERILNLAPAPTDTEATRRARVARVFAFVGFATNSGYLASILSSALGSAFVAVEHIDYSIAVIDVPDGSYPWGTVSSDAPWSSTVAHLMIRLQKPTGWTEGQFYAAAAMVFTLLDPVVPAWVTIDYYRGGPTAAPVVGGPSAGGFILDDSPNLDNEVFGS